MRNKKFFLFKDIFKHNSNNNNNNINPNQLNSLFHNNLERVILKPNKITIFSFIFSSCENLCYFNSNSNGNNSNPKPKRHAIFRYVINHCRRFPSCLSFFFRMNIKIYKILVFSSPGFGGKINVARDSYKHPLFWCCHIKNIIIQWNIFISNGIQLKHAIILIIAGLLAHIWGNFCWVLFCNGKKRAESKTMLETTKYVQ